MRFARDFCEVLMVRNNFGLVKIVYVSLKQGSENWGPQAKCGSLGIALSS